MKKVVKERTVEDVTYHCDYCDFSSKYDCEVERHENQEHLCDHTVTYSHSFNAPLQTLFVSKYCPKCFYDHGSDYRTMVNIEAVFGVAAKDFFDLFAGDIDEVNIKITRDNITGGKT